MPGQRPLHRWAVRLVRREMRQQLLILAMIALATAIASFGAVMLHHANQPPSAFTGGATVRLDINDPDETSGVIEQVAADLAGPADITAAGFMRTAGSSRDFTVIDPPINSAVGAEPVRLIRGRRPAAAGEIALNGPLAASLDATIGSTIEAHPVSAPHRHDALRDAQTGNTADARTVEMTVVGLVEDPSNLKQRLAVVAPGHVREPFRVSVLMSPTGDDLHRLVPYVHGLRPEEAMSPSAEQGDRLLREHDLVHGEVLGQDQLLGQNRRQLQSVTAEFVLAAAAMVEVALLCSAAFAVLAQRRLREFGLLSAAGATARQVGQALLLNGLALGAFGGVLGVAAGYGTSMLARPLLEQILGWRIGAWSLPWLAVLPFVALASVTALAAAWIPSRRLARLAPTDALSSRRPRAAPAGRKGLAGAAGFVTGAVLLGFGTSVGSPIAAVAGLLVAVAGILATTPLAVASAGRLAHRLPLAPRIALRDISRYRSRSAACLAALVVAFGLPTAIVVTSASADAGLDTGPSSLPDNVAVVWPGSPGWRSLPDDLGDHTAVVAEAVDAVADIVVAEISVLADPAGDGPSDPGAPHTGILQVFRSMRSDLAVPPPEPDAGQPEPQELFDVRPVWVATPELLRAVGADPALAHADVEMLGDPGVRSYLPTAGRGLGSTTPVREPLDVRGTLRTLQPGDDRTLTALQPEPLGVPAYGHIAEYWMPEARVAALGLEPAVKGWIIAKTTPLTDADKSAIHRHLPVGLVAEVPLPPQDNAALRRNASLVSGAAALAIVALTAALLRSESGNEQRVLAALGAGRATRRRIAAATTGFLALAGAALALPTGYLALVAIMSDRGAGFPLVFPAGTLGPLLVGTPVVTAAAAYFLAFREPAELARPPS